MINSCDVNVEGVGGQNSTPLKVGVGWTGQWEFDDNIWLKALVQNIEKIDLKSELETKLKMIQTKKEVRTVVISRRKRKGQPRETGVAMQRIYDMFRDAGSSPMVVEDLVGNVIKRKYLSDEESSMVSDRKRHKGL